MCSAGCVKFWQLGPSSWDWYLIAAQHIPLLYSILFLWKNCQDDWGWLLSNLCRFKFWLFWIILFYYCRNILKKQYKFFYTSKKIFKKTYFRVRICKLFISGFFLCVFWWRGKCWQWHCIIPYKYLLWALHFWFPINRILSFTSKMQKTCRWMLWKHRWRWWERKVDLKKITIIRIGKWQCRLICIFSQWKNPELNSFKVFKSQIQKSNSESKLQLLVIGWISHLTFHHEDRV